MHGHRMVQLQELTNDFVKRTDYKTIHIIEHFYHSRKPFKSITVYTTQAKVDCAKSFLDNSYTVI